MSEKLVYIVAGPTASGKSRLAIDLALKLNGVVINCDAMQIYRDIPIISAAPENKEKALVEHRLFEIYDCDKRGNVVEWLDLCVAEIKKCWQQKKLPIVVGGTGMYIDALINGVTPIPEVPQKIRQQVEQKLQTEGLKSLYQWLQQNDPITAQKLHPNDKTRITRAVEIIMFSSQKLSDWYQKPMLKKLPEADFKVVKIVPSLDVIAERCKKRLDEMVYELGAIDEVQKLAKLNLSSDLPAMKALGVPELLQYIKGQTSLGEAVNLAKLHTRQYAKRQRTWLKHKLVADIEFTEPYDGQSKWINEILK